MAYPVVRWQEAKLVYVPLPQPAAQLSCLPLSRLCQLPLSAAARQLGPCLSHAANKCLPLKTASMARPSVWHAAYVQCSDEVWRAVAAHLNSIVRGRWLWTSVHVSQCYSQSAWQSAAVAARFPPHTVPVRVCQRSTRAMPA